MKRAVLGIFVFATLAYAPTAYGEDVSGWQGAKWGMTPDEVQRTLSYPTFAADLAKVCGPKCVEGAALELDDYDLNGQHFVVRFWFTRHDKRLHAVSMYAKPENGKDNITFANMKEFLETLYGLPQATQLKRGYFIFTWDLPSTKIILNANSTTKMTVVYEEKTKEDDGKSQSTQ